MKINVNRALLLTLFVFILTSRISAQDKTMDWYVKQAPFNMEKVITPTFKQKTYSITDFGGISNGETMNTEAFRKAINACTAAGGGRVVVPAGLWLTGPIELKSNVDLHLDRGALVIFTKDHTQYPMIKMNPLSSSYVTASPIYGTDLTNIAITGEGIFDGAGDTWRPVKKAKVTASQWKDITSSGGVTEDGGSVWWPGKEAMEGENILKALKDKGTKQDAENVLPAREYLRPHMLYLVNCTKILLQDITLRNSPKFVFYPNNCTNLTMERVNIFNEWWAQNGDGIDISACKSVMIYKCNVSAGDDGICMKSSSSKKDVAGGANLENVIVAGCNVYHAHGGFVIGSNTDGGMRNIFVKDCNFVGTDIGIRVKSNAGRGGLVKDIYIFDIFMKDIVNEAVSFDTYYEDLAVGKGKESNTPKDKVPDFQDFYITDVFCNGAKTAVKITGLPDAPVHKLHFKNVNISSKEGFVATDAADIDLNNVKLIADRTPVYELKNVKGLTLNQGFLPQWTKVLIKSDKQSSGIKVSNTDLRNIPDAIQESK
jgi:polygalacturonase